MPKRWNIISCPYTRYFISPLQNFEFRKSSEIKPNFQDSRFHPYLFPISLKPFKKSISARIPNRTYSRPNASSNHLKVLLTAFSPSPTRTRCFLTIVQSFSVIAWSERVRFPRSSMSNGRDSSLRELTVAPLADTIWRSLNSGSRSSLVRTLT